MLYVIKACLKKGWECKWKKNPQTRDFYRELIFYLHLKENKIKFRELRQCE